MLILLIDGAYCCNVAVYALIYRQTILLATMWTKIYDLLNNRT